MLFRQPVAVRGEGRAPRHVELCLAGIERDAEILGQELAAPTVVVTANERDRDAPAADVVESSHGCEVAPWDDAAVFEPEVEQVAVDEQSVAKVGDGGEEGVECRLYGGGGLSQMGGCDHHHAGGQGGHGPRPGNPG